jgi:hypothetical protein
LPLTEQDANNIVRELRKLATPRGFKASNEFEYFDKPIFPYSKIIIPNTKEKQHA